MLEGSHRFADDPEWGETLKRVRNGTDTVEDREKINERWLHLEGIALPTEGDICYACPFNRGRNAIITVGSKHGLGWTRALVSLSNAQLLLNIHMEELNQITTTYMVYKDTIREDRKRPLSLYMLNSRLTLDFLLTLTKSRFSPQQACADQNMKGGTHLKGGAKEVSSWTNSYAWLQT